jgi:pyridinium-3,5-biscarboxylic acid mononucleotide synthase
MEYNALLTILQSLHDHSSSVEEAAVKFRGMGFDDLDFAKVDHHRGIRKGYPEVIFCQNKTSGQIIDIIKNQLSHDETVFGTRVSLEALEVVKTKIPELETSAVGRCFWHKSTFWKIKENLKGSIVIAAAGTSDLPVVEEARCTIEILGHPCVVLNDVGVAGIHRLFFHKNELQKAAVIIAVAGMEGALPSVIAGLVSCPVIGVPTSVGYGSHLNGIVPLLAMLNSCASGLTVVNIDNGFGAAYAAVLMNTGAGA